VGKQLKGDPPVHLERQERKMEGKKGTSPKGKPESNALFDIFHFSLMGELRNTASFFFILLLRLYLLSDPRVLY
jgi:hypothetical protein